MQPIDPTAGLPSFTIGVPAAINVESVLAVIITIVFIWWAIYSLVVIYHWMRYGRESWLAVPALTLHFFVSGWIFVFATGGLH